MLTELPFAGVERRWTIDEAGQERAQEGFRDPRRDLSPGQVAVVVVEDDLGELHVILEVDEDGWRGGEFSGRATCIGVGYMDPGQHADAVSCQTRCDASLIPAGALSLEAEGPGQHLLSVFGMGVLKVVTGVAGPGDWSREVVHVELSEWAPIAEQLRGCEPRALRSVSVTATVLSEADFTALAALPNLTHLDLRDVYGLWPHSALRRFARLTHLVLPRSDGKIEESALLGSLQALVHLDLGATQVSDLGWLGRLGKLESLALPNLDTGHAPIAHLRDLRRLRVGSNRRVSDLSALAELKRLEILELRKCDALADLSGLRGLGGLRYLQLDGAEHLVDLGPLRGLTNLGALSLGGAFSDLEPLRALTRLRALTFCACPRLVDLSPLTPREPSRGLVGWLGRLFGGSPPEPGGLTELRQLSLGVCGSLSDLGPLAKLTALSDLRLCYMPKLCVIDRLADLRGLRQLRLGPELDQLTDLRSLGALTSLRQLALLGLPSGVMLPDLRAHRELTELIGRVAADTEGGLYAGTLIEAPALRRLELEGPFELGLLAVSPRLSALELTWPSDAAPPGLEALAGHGGLRRLLLDGGSRPWDLAGLSGHASLRSLTVWAGVAGLVPLPGLRELEIPHGTAISDLGPLREATMLSRLEIGGVTGCGDLSPLAGLLELQYLELGNAGRVVDLGSLASMRSLRGLSLEGASRLTDLRPLTGLAALRSVMLTRCVSLSDISPLLDLPWLRLLGLHLTEVPEAALAGLRDQLLSFVVSSFSEQLAEQYAESEPPMLVTIGDTGAHRDPCLRLVREVFALGRAQALAIGHGPVTLDETLPRDIAEQLVGELQALGVEAQVHEPATVTLLHPGCIDEDTIDCLKQALEITEAEAEEFIAAVPVKIGEDLPITALEGLVRELEALGAQVLPHDWRAGGEATSMQT